MAEKFVPPGNVMSPKRFWTLVSVIYDEGEGEAAAAIGRWDGKPVLAMRWNGSEENPIGNPQSRGLPIWFVIPTEFREPILKSILKVSPEKQALVHDFFSAK
jgi:hypothetical protein